MTVLVGLCSCPEILISPSIDLLGDLYVAGILQAALLSKSLLLAGSCELPRALPDGMQRLGLRQDASKLALCDRLRYLRLLAPGLELAAVAKRAQHGMMGQDAPVVSCAH